LNILKIVNDNTANQMKSKSTIFFSIRNCTKFRNQKERK